jgi:hypothetical protein
LGTGAVCLGGGDCQRNIISSKHCALKKRSKNRPKLGSFFLFLRCGLIEIVERSRFFTKIPSFATCDRSALMQSASRRFASDAFSRLLAADCAASRESCDENCGENNVAVRGPIKSAQKTPASRSLVEVFRSDTHRQSHNSSTKIGALINVG